MSLDYAQRYFFERCQGSASISTDGRYRYSLKRVWDGNKPVMTWVMLNPSTADAESDDQTIRRCAGYAMRDNFGGIEVVNLFAFRATLPRDLARASDPEGPENETTVHDAVARSTFPVIAWGTQPVDLLKRSKVFTGYLPAFLKIGFPLWYLGATKDGSPRHPSRLAADLPFERVSRWRYAR